MKTRDGYALPLTLAAIIIIALVATTAARQVRSSTDALVALSSRTEIETRLISAEQTMIYRALTEPITRSGVSVGAASDIAALFAGGADVNTGNLIRANGIPYAFEGDIPVLIRLTAQDSYFNLGATNPAVLSPILDLYGIPQDQHSRFSATLADYQDEDSLRSLGGAEANDYDQEGLPTNQPLQSITELCAIHLWSDSAVCDDINRLLVTAKLRAGEHPRPGLIAESALSLMLPDTQTRQRAMENFETGQWRFFSQIQQPEFDQVFDPLAVLGNPGPVFTIITQTPDARRIRQTIVELTPSSLRAPFVIRGNYDIGGAFAQSLMQVESVENVKPFPASSDNASGRR